MRQRRAYINLKARTKDTLDSIRASGQSYDGVIQELIILSKENNLKKQANNRKEASGKVR